MQYTNSEIDSIIAERIHNEKYRRVLHLRFVDGITYERIAEITEMSPRQIKNIVKRHSADILPEQRMEICFS